MMYISDENEVRYEQVKYIFQMAMRAENQLQVKVLPLSPETPVFRMPDVEDEDEMPLLDPNPSVPQIIPQTVTQTVPQPQVIEREDGKK